MKILVILAHPTEGSLNHAIASAAIGKIKDNGHEAIYHDLFKEKFDPILNTKEIPKNGEYDENIKRHCSDLTESDGIIIIHPNWWGMPPAILKGWIDRVIRPGIAYEFEEGDSGDGVPVGLLKAKTAIVFNTANTSKEREVNIFKDPLETIWKNCIFDLCGIKNFYRRMFTIVVTSGEKQRKEWLFEVEEIIDRFFPKNNL